MFLPGPNGSGLATSGYGNRAVYLAGGHIGARVAGLAGDYSVSMWFWNGLPTDARDVTGTLLSTDGETLLIAGKAEGDEAGQLVLRPGLRSHVGKTRVTTKGWHQVTITRADRRVRVYLDGSAVPEIDAQIKPKGRSQRLLIGSDGDPETTFDGKIDEVAVFDRALAAGDKVLPMTVGAFQRVH